MYSISNRIQCTKIHLSLILHSRLISRQMLKIALEQDGLVQQMFGL
nr:MAG TPA: hypothetical protein [Crassvirales sp.]